MASSSGVNTPSQIVSGTTPASSSSGSSSSNSASSANALASQQIAGNFQSFLELLTTQLQNQNPLDPLDTNQFTQQLVEFASVEQQVNMNTNLQTLIGLQQTQDDTAALQMLGDTVTINSTTGSLSSTSPASWSLNSASPANATVTITSSSGQIAYSGTTTLNAGSNTYTWNGTGNNGVTWPAGNYTISVSATSASGQSVTVTPQVQGVVSAINVTQSPPQVTVNGQAYPLSQIQSISTAASTASGAVASTANSLTGSLNSLNSSVNSLLSKL
jgi:flagellar basal-body rod modification protein FlgD